MPAKKTNKGKYKVKKQINPKCPKCDRRVTYLMDFIHNRKRVVLCAKCYDEWQTKHGPLPFRQLTLMDDEGLPRKGIEET